MTDQIKAMRESIEAELKKGFTDLQQKYDNVSEALANF